MRREDEMLEELFTAVAAGDIARAQPGNHRRDDRQVDDRRRRRRAGAAPPRGRPAGRRRAPWDWGPAWSARQVVQVLILAVGAHLKNTVALAMGDQVFVSQHIGDLETAEALGAEDAVELVHRESSERVVPVDENDRAGRVALAVVEAAGIRDIVSKIMGSDNKASNVYATFAALKHIDKIVRIKGISIKASKEVTDTVIQPRPHNPRDQHNDRNRGRRDDRAGAQSQRKE